MGIKRSIEIAALELAVKPSRLAADAAMQQATRELLADEQVRPAARKPKNGKQVLQGRVRVERSRPAREVEVEESFSWGYVQPRGVVTAHRDGFTVGVVDGSGAMGEAKDLPVYRFNYIDGGRSYRVIRDFGLGLARRLARRYAKTIAEAQGAMVWVDEKLDCLILVWEDDQQTVDFGHIRSKSQLRELIRK